MPTVKYNFVAIETFLNHRNSEKVFIKPPSDRCEGAAKERGARLPPARPPGRRRRRHGAVPQKGITGIRFIKLDRRDEGGRVKFYAWRLIGEDGEWSHKRGRKTRSKARRSRAPAPAHPGRRLPGLDHRVASCLDAPFHSGAASGRIRTTPAAPRLARIRSPRQEPRR